MKKSKSYSERKIKKMDEPDAVKAIMDGMNVNETTARAFYNIIMKKNLLSYDDLAINKSVYYEEADSEDKERLDRMK